MDRTTSTVSAQSVLKMFRNLLKQNEKNVSTDPDVSTDAFPEDHLVRC